MTEIKGVGVIVYLTKDLTTCELFFCILASFQLTHSYTGTQVLYVYLSGFLSIFGKG